MDIFPNFEPAQMLYAIVDIETTGGHASSHGMTEIAIVIHDGKQILNKFETLINPQIPIPYFIQRLTGINERMVERAPLFQEVAAQIHELLQDKVFVAHNVNFDYSFVKHHLQTAGFDLQTKKLCTIRLARKIVPGYTHYGLGKLCHQLGIPHGDHHRAGGDATATAHLFTLLNEKDNKNVIAEMLLGKNSESYLPPNLPIEHVEELPKKPGVYYFYNGAGKIIYVGKAKNIFRRVKNHFSNNKIGKQKQDFLKDIHRITYQETATELLAHILESVEIRKLWPIHNRSQKGYLPKFGLYIYEDQLGFQRLAIEKNKQVLRPVYSFNTIYEGHQRLRELIKEFGLCPRLCNLAKTNDCIVAIETNDCVGNCNKPLKTYNKKVSKAVVWLEKHLPSFAYLDKGRTAAEQSCILIEKGNFFGFGYINEPSALKNLDKLKQHLEPMQDNDFVRNLVYKSATVNPSQCIYF